MSAPSVITAAAVGAACGVVLNVLYMAVKHAWPENYFGLEGSVDPVVSRNVARYAGFRFAPPFITASAAGITSDRLGHSAAISVVTAMVVHLVRPSGDILARARQRQWGRLQDARQYCSES